MSSQPERQSQQQRQATPSTGSQTQVVQQATSTPSSSEPQTQAILRLRGAHTDTGRSVQWAEDVVDNEGLGRKKSKVCCIYHRPRAVDESSDSSDSSDSDYSSSDSDAGGKSGRVPAGAGGGGGGGSSGPGAGHDHQHDRGHDCNGHRHDRSRRRKGGDPNKGKRRKPSPNAYERVPKNKSRGDTTDPRPTGPDAPQAPGT